MVMSGPGRGLGPPPAQLFARAWRRLTRQKGKTQECRDGVHVAPSEVDKVRDEWRTVRTSREVHITFCPACGEVLEAIVPLERGR